jgi:hypothetical protein
MDTAQRYVAGYLDAVGRMTTCRAGQVSDAGPQRRHPVAGWLMGVRLGGAQRCWRRVISRAERRDRHDTGTCDTATGCLGR